MADAADLPPGYRPGPPPADALAFFRTKKLKPGFNWRDV